jgi:hypothetical protein
MRPAIKTASGKVVTATRPGMSHNDLGVAGKRGFVEGGKFMGRQAAAKIAKVPGVKSLHSHNLPAAKVKRK